LLVVEITLSYFSHGAVMRRARQETKALLNAGHRVIVITDLKWKSAYPEIKEFRDKLYVIPIKPFYIHKPFRKVSSELSFTFKVYFALKKISEKESIDLIIIHSSTVSYAVARFAKKMDIPAAWVIHDIVKYRIATGNPYKLITTQLYKHADSYAFRKLPFIIAVSNDTRNLAVIYGANPKNTFFKHNPVDTQFFTPNKNVIKDIDVLFLGRLSVEKGVDILIEATKSLSKERRILIIGDGVWADKLKYQARQTKSNIIFRGFVDHKLLPQYFHRAKILAAPSRSEFHAVVPLEAMACGVPVIASRVAGMKESIEHNKSGWLLEKNNAETLGNLIENILSNEKRLKIASEEARKRAEFFSEIKFGQSVIEFFKMLIERFNDNKKY